MKEERVERHNMLVRLTHWSVALSGLALVFSGFGQLPMYKRYFVDKIPGFGWSSNFDINFVIHIVSAVIFSSAVMFHIVYHWRRGELSAMPKKGDFRESMKIIKAMITGKEEPPHDKFLAEQRVAYAVIGVFSLTLIFTGLLKTFKNMGHIIIPEGFLTFITLIHTIGAMIFLMLIIFHLGAFLIKSNWPMLPSMITGTVKKSYVDKRHPLWKYKK